MFSKFSNAFLIVLIVTTSNADANRSNSDGISTDILPIWSHFDCEVHNIHNQRSGSEVTRWTICVSTENESFSVLGERNSQNPIALEYSVSNGRSNLLAKLDEQEAEINSEYSNGLAIMDVLFEAVDTASPVVHAAQISMQGPSCNEIDSVEVQSSSLWSTSGSLPNHSPISNISSFYDDLSVHRTSELVDRILALMDADGVLSDDTLPRFAKTYNSFDSVIPSLLSFSIMFDSLEKDTDGELAGMVSCALLALGATGAIVGAITQNPSLAAPCGGSCGGALTCLATLAGGGTFGVGCGVAVGSCMGCVGLGYASNLAGCFRVFFEVE